MRIVVPPSLRGEMLIQLHETHQGINKSKRRAREIMFWSGMGKHIEDMIKDCPPCSENQKKLSDEPMIGSRTPDLPWTKIASDIFHWEGADYFSKYIEADKLANLTSKQLIEVFKAQISRHGIPEKLRADNGTQLTSAEFEGFLNEYGIKLITSSPRYPRSNGEAEKAVQTVKRLWCNTKDKHLALLDYRSTPLESCGLSPSQLLNSRRCKTKFPIKKDLLKPQTQDLEEIKRKLDQKNDIQIKHYNKKAGKEHAPLKPGEDIRMTPLPGKKKWLPGTVVGLHTSPRSYVVDCSGRKYRRNRMFLRPATREANKQDEVSTQENSWSDQNTDVGPNVKDLSFGKYDQQPKTTPQTHTEA
jgi:hypothetical protein